MTSIDRTLSFSVAPAPVDAGDFYVLTVDDADMLGPIDRLDLYEGRPVSHVDVEEHCRSAPVVASLRRDAVDPLRFAGVALSPFVAIATWGVAHRSPEAIDQDGPVWIVRFQVDPPVFAEPPPRPPPTEWRAEVRGEFTRFVDGDWQIEVAIAPADAEPRGFVGSRDPEKP